MCGIAVGVPYLLVGGSLCVFEPFMAPHLLIGAEQGRKSQRIWYAAAITRGAALCCADHLHDGDCKPVRTPTVISLSHRKEDSVHHTELGEVTYFTSKFDFCSTYVTNN